MDISEAEQLVVAQCGCSSEQARRALDACGGDVVDALLLVTAEQDAAAASAGVVVPTPVIALTEEEECVELIVAANQCSPSAALEALRHEKGDLINALLYMAATATLSASAPAAAPARGPPPLSGGPPPIPPRKPLVKMGKSGRIVSLSAAAPQEEDSTHFFDSVVEDGEQDADPDAFAAGLSLTLRDDRLKIAAEMLSSEQSYFHSLFVLRDQYVRHILLRLPPRDAFVQLSSVLEALIPPTLHLLQRLETCVRSWPAEPVSQCFPHAQLRELEQHYFNYAQCCQTVMADLKAGEKDEPFTELLKTLKREAAPGTMEIRSYLIMPVQRLPRYELLMRQMLSATSPGHEAHSALKETLATLESANRGVNERMRAFANAKQIAQLRQRFVSEPGLLDTQVLLREGPVIKRTSKGLMEKRVLLLFADELAYAKPAAFGGALVLGFKAPLRLCRIVDLPDQDRLKWRFELRVTSGKTSLIYLDSLETKMEWMLAITNATASEISRTPDGKKYRPRPEDATVAPLYSSSSASALRALLNSSNK
jgi:hypothetical protein